MNELKKEIEALLFNAKFEQQNYAKESKANLCSSTISSCLKMLRSIDDKNVSVEFAEWLVQNANAVRFNRFSYKDLKEYSTTELFNKFIEQRNKTTL